MNRSSPLATGLSISENRALVKAYERSIIGEGSLFTIPQIIEWLTSFRNEIEVRVEPTQFSKLTQWDYKKEKGEYHHISGGFFQIKGISVQTNYGFVENWQQPIINQSEIGLLGIISKEISGTLHFLMQAKIEPGNYNIVQISPTLQATRSNYLRKHKGRPPHI